MEMFQVIISVITVVGAVFGSYMGVKMAITRLEVRVDGIDKRLIRVEDKVFE